MKVIKPEEFSRFINEIKESFAPIDDYDCPDIRKRIIEQGEQIERLNCVDLMELPIGSSIYFTGQQGPAYYTLKICENNIVKAWRDVDANALSAPIQRITSRNHRLDQIVLEEGRLTVGNIFYMPYFNYNNDLESSTVKRVLPPDECYFGICTAIFLKR